MSEEMSRFGALLNAGVNYSGESIASPHIQERGLDRLWRGFMAARILVAIVLLGVMLFLRYMGQAAVPLALAICLLYLVLTIWVRVVGQPNMQRLKPSSSWLDKLGFDAQWLVTVGADVGIFGALLYLQVGGLNYSALFVLPVLFAAITGSLLMALGTAAAVTIALLLDVFQFTFISNADAASRYVQAALTGTGLFAVAYLANQLAARLAREEQVARGSEMAARAQIQVNQLVIDTLSDGVLVLDINGIVHAVNPAACDMLSHASQSAQRSSMPITPFVLAARAGWQEVADLAIQSMRSQVAMTREITLSNAQGTPLRLSIKTQLSAKNAQSGSLLCVMFMEDLREIEARLRTEKLAAMGRMSAAVAHEIRNPLSAISQANALLSEETLAPEQKRLIEMVAQNVQRLARIVDDVLDVSRAQSQLAIPSVLNDSVAWMEQVCADWAQQNKHDFLHIALPRLNLSLRFEQEHLRRVLVNLLDNAKRHAVKLPGSIQVSLERDKNAWLLQVWSQGEPIEQGVERHLFEPFFSSQSRSSGLGLFICRELCRRHAASIGYQRSERVNAGTKYLGNEFFVRILNANAQAALAPIH